MNLWCLSYFQIVSSLIRSTNIISNSPMQSQNLRIPPLRSTLSMCEGCIFKNHHQLPYSMDPTTRIKKVLTLVHTNLCGPVTIESFGKIIYFLIFMDDYSCYICIYFLQKKSTTLLHFTQNKALVENQPSKKILFVRSNYGGEFTSTNFNKFCMD